MSRTPLSRAVRLVNRNNLRETPTFPGRLAASSSSRQAAVFVPRTIIAVAPQSQHHAAPRRLLSTTPSRPKGLMPESDNPPAPKSTPEAKPTAHAAEITEAQYHELADEYLETILSKFEELADEREDIDVEFAAGVLTVSFPQIGTYVINKQPPNKQIWLSSPKSGPKRYDWAVVGDGQEQKGGTAAGDWIYLRDGTTLNDLFLEELAVDLSMPIPHYGG